MHAACCRRAIGNCRRRTMRRGRPTSSATQIFSRTPLAGKRILVYQHSAVGRDLLVGILQTLGRGGRDLRAQRDLRRHRHGGDRRRATGHDSESLACTDDPVLAVVSHGWRQRSPADSRRRRRAGEVFSAAIWSAWLSPEYLGADAVVVPISCNDAIDRGPLAAVLEPKTPIGSPACDCRVWRGAGERAQTRLRMGGEWRVPAGLRYQCAMAGR